MDQDFISITELAKALGISRQATLKQIKGKINAGVIETRTEGKKYLLKFETLPDDIKKRVDESTKETSEKAQKITPGKDIHYEKELWAAADRLRGNIDASEYKHVVLGLLFLKYISDAYYQRREKLTKWMSDPTNSKYYIPNEKTREKELENKIFYKNEGIFYIPEKARWEYLRNKAALPDIAKHIDDAMEAIENENPQQLQGVLPKNYVRVPLESHILGELVNIFSRIDFTGDEKQEKEDR